jgi:hypothetical protein
MADFRFYIEDGSSNFLQNNGNYQNILLHVQKTVIALALQKYK